MLLLWPEQTPTENSFAATQSEYRHERYIKAHISFVGHIRFGLFLSLLPVPEMLEPFRPDWVTAILLYWVIALPHRVSVGYAWCMGLFLDVLLGSTMGLRAFSLSVVAYIASVQCQRLRNYSVGQQAIVIGLLVLLSKLLTFWGEHALNASPCYNLLFMVCCINHVVMAMDLSYFA